MDQQILEALRAAKRRLEEANSCLRPGSLGRAKNDDVIAMIENVLPIEKISVDQRSFNSELVYPNRN